MKNKKRRINMLSILVVAAMVFALAIPANGFQVFTAWKFYDPHDISYTLSTTVGQYTTYITECVETWETYCPQITVSRSANASGNVYFYGDLSVYNGFYGLSSASSSNDKTVTLYGDFLSLTTVEQKETIVHEMGHCFGLLHCEGAMVTISVMRDEGFNYKPYPLTDDINGIAFLYPYD